MWSHLIKKKTYKIQDTTEKENNVLLCISDFMCIWNIVEFSAKVVVFVYLVEVLNVYITERGEILVIESIQMCPLFFSFSPSRKNSVK